VTVLAASAARMVSAAAVMLMVTRAVVDCMPTARSTRRKNGAATENFFMALVAQCKGLGRA
jgi:hypothetical protein